MASAMRQPLPPCCHAVHAGRKDTAKVRTHTHLTVCGFTAPACSRSFSIYLCTKTQVRFKTELSKFAVAAKQQGFARLASALTEARSALQLDRGAVSASSSSSENPSNFSSVEDIQAYTHDIVAYLSLVKGFSSPPSTAAATNTATTELASPAFVSSETPTAALRQPLIDDHSPLNNAAGLVTPAASATRTIGESSHVNRSTYSAHLSFCVWKDVLSNAQLHAVNAHHEYAQTLLASGLYMMNDARKKVDLLLANRLSELNETQLKLAYQLFLNAAGMFEACLESINVKPRAIGAAPTDFSATPEPEAVVAATGDNNSSSSGDGIPDDEMMKKWRAEQLNADAGERAADAAGSPAADAGTGAKADRATGELALIDRVPDLARGRYPQLLVWIALAEAQELVILRGISRDFVDYALMAKLSIDISTRYKESHALAAQTLPCSTSPLADKMRLYTRFKDAYYAAISCYFQGAASMAKDDALSCAQAIANFKLAQSLMQKVLPLKQSYEEAFKQQKDERERLETFKSIYLRSQQIVDRDLDIMTHRNDSVYYERVRGSGQRWWWSGDSCLSSYHFEIVLSRLTLPGAHVCFFIDPRA